MHCRVDMDRRNQNAGGVQGFAGGEGEGAMQPGEGDSGEGVRRSTMKFPYEIFLSLRNHTAMATSSATVSIKKPVTQVIFYMDGLLLDTENFYTQVREIIFARYNKTFDWNLRAKMMGMKAIEVARVFVEDTGISDSLSV
ncbi:hypothetical protein TanjilG_31229 [Lupinus angustifolius]|uniref:Uncharacterized protein n=1 Tax=Lupinus angustifolius TaxID=3871 RepID=A0A394DDI4_LUPAN|nr:hypothetical protein TanjilG_31229 [Lupinus angustifolius]